MLLDGTKLIPWSNFITIWIKPVGDIQSDLRVSYYLYFHAFASVKFCILTNYLVFGSVSYEFNKSHVLKFQLNYQYFYNISEVIIKEFRKSKFNSVILWVTKN